MGRTLTVARNGDSGLQGLSDWGWRGGVSKEETQEFLREGHSLWRGLTTCTRGSSRDEEGVRGRPPFTGVLLRISL